MQQLTLTNAPCHFLATMKNCNLSLLRHAFKPRNMNAHVVPLRLLLGRTVSRVGVFACWRDPRKNLSSSP